MSEIESGKRGTRQTNMDLNLVPFIDLMSVLISFLLITAVWTQVSMIQIGSSLYGKKSDTQPPPEPPPHSDIVLKVEVRPSGYVLTVGKQAISLPMKSGTYDEAGLMAQLQRVKQLYPDKQDAVVAVADTLAYENMINAMDTLLVTGFTAISVATGGP
jgi:biopolymer transport protein TolR